MVSFRSAIPGKSALSQRNTGKKKWYAVQTKPRQEDIADVNLQRQSFHTYLPKILLRRRKRGQWKKVVEPLFPNYLFIKVDAKKDSLSPVRSTLGVVGLVRFGKILTPVPDNIIEYMKQAEDPVTQHHQAEDWPHQPGDSVEILEGPFAGLETIFLSRDGENRALLLVEFLGRQNKLEVYMGSISKTA